MRVIVPFAGDVHPDTLNAVASWPDLELVDLSRDPEYGYGKLLRRLWGEAEDVLIVEQDVVPHPWTLGEFAMCEHPYCAAPYELQAYVGPAMGCTKFSSLFLRCYPDAMEIASRIISPITGKPGYYIGLDVWLQGAVLAERHGWQPHIHMPPVGHRNPARELCEAAKNDPVRTTVAWGQRIYLAPGTVDAIAREVEAERSDGPGKMRG